MANDQIAHTARRVSRRNGWEMSWLPGQNLDPNTAITAMMLAGTTAEQDLHDPHPPCPHIQSWAELGLTEPQAAATAYQLPADLSRHQERATARHDLEAADRQ